MEFSLAEVGAFLTAIGAFIGALVLAYRGLSSDRFSRKVSESASLLTGYTEMVKNLRVEINEIRNDHDKENIRNKGQYQEDLERLANLHKHELDSIMAVYAEERKQWMVERVYLSKQISELSEALDSVKTEVYLLKNPPTKLPEGNGEQVNE